MGWSGGSDPVELGTGRVVNTTDKAVLVEVDGTETWLPKSVLHEDSEIDEDSGVDDEGLVVVKKWFADKEGLG